MTTIGRRAFLALGTVMLGACGESRPILVPSPSASAALPLDPFGDLERSVGGRVGVFALDTGSGRELARRPDERFAMCSTFKWLLVARVLAGTDRGELDLQRDIAFSETDLLEYAPVTRAHAGEGRMTIEALAGAAITLSDNTAANLLLREIGGPAGLTSFARSIGDESTRLDRGEPTLNTNVAGDPRDTTTPRAMVATMKRILVGDVLAPTSRAKLLGWLEACETGRERLRAGLPRAWRTGDKTGSGERGAANDVAITTPPSRAPILVAAYLSDGAAKIDALNATHAAIGRAVAAAFA